MKHFKLLALALTLMLALPLAGVFAQDDGDDDMDDDMMEMTELPVVDPLLVQGDIVTAGSSTVGPLTQVMIERFEEAAYTGTITLDIIGSGAGFDRFCVAGETDISNASRPIRESEIEACGELDPARTPIEFRVGTDALAITVSADNDFIGEEGLTTEQLAQIFSGGTGITWADVNPDWPAEPILLYSPGDASGTFDFFVEAIFEDLAEEEGVENPEEYLLGAEGIQFSEDDNVLVTGVQDSPFAIGYFGYAYYLENSDVLNSLSINGVAPSAESVEAAGDEAYPLARPLFIYSDADIMCEKSQVADFINYYLSNVNDVIVDVGYFPASDSALNGARQAWVDAVATCE